MPKKVIFSLLVSVLAVTIMFSLSGCATGTIKYNCLAKGATAEIIDDEIDGNNAIRIIITNNNGKEISWFLKDTGPNSNYQILKAGGSRLLGSESGGTYEISFTEHEIYVLLYYGYDRDNIAGIYLND